MHTNAFEIDQRLMADSHEFFCWKQYHVRLNKNANIAWFLIIPETDEIEFCELPNKQQLEITYLSKVLGMYMKSNSEVKKINFAAIGNVVQQLHVHVVGRHPNDPLWPDVVWGNALPEKKYTNHELVKIKTDLLNLLEQQE